MGTVHAIRPLLVDEGLDYLTASQPEPFFVDWLSLYQQHAERLPVVDAGCVIAADTNGVLQWKTVRRCPIAGSHETTVNVRCDGETVWFEGNVSRFGRTNNVFGFDLAECLRRVNEILVHIGLPPFTWGRKGASMARVENGKFSAEDRGRCFDLTETWSGARITRIDLTTNFEAGSISDARAYMEWLGTQQHSARVKVGTNWDGETVDFGRGSRRVYAKAYLKHAELKRHGAPLPLIEHCENVGLIRFEVTVKSTQLIAMGCQYLGSLDMGKLIQLYEDRRAVMSRAEHSHDDLETLPNSFRRTARDYLAGDDVRSSLSERSFRRHRAAILPFGIDIAVRRNVLNFVPKVRVIELKPATVPNWYQFQYESERASA